MTVSSLPLHSASVYIHLNNAYFLCGIKSNNKPTKKIYYINLVLENYSYEQLDKNLPFKLIKPIIAINNLCIAVTGGIKISGEDNFDFFFY